MNKIKSVVVDDEASNRRLIIKLISKLNRNFEILGEAKSVADAYSLINDVKPQLVFLDIKMADGSGFDLLNRFYKINFEVVFISGFDRYALKAFEYNALDYVLKPINPLKFSKTLEKVRNRIEDKGFKPVEIKEILKTYDLKELTIARISVHQGNKVIFLNVKDMVSVRSEEGNVCFKMNTGEKYNSAKELSDFSFILENYPFLVRTSKSVYINLNYISSYSKGTTCIISMKDGTEVEVSRRKKGEILELLKQTQSGGRP